MECGPLYVHKTHGRNVKMSADMRQATRVKGFHKTVCFSNRPVGVNEQVHIKINNVWTERFGVIRFGCLSLKPLKMSMAKLPSNMSNGLTKKPGYFAMELPAKCVIKDKVLSFYVTPAGSVTYAVCGVEEGTLFSGVDISRPLWVVIDISANTTSAEIVATSGRARVDRPLRSSLSQSVDDECIVCMDRTADCVLVPCAHACLCYTCAVTIRASENASCPMCRHVIDGVNKKRRPHNKPTSSVPTRHRADITADEGLRGEAP